jgi:hypothetical protein
MTIETRIAEAMPSAIASPLAKPIEEIGPCCNIRQNPPGLYRQPIALPGIGRLAARLRGLVRSKISGSGSGSGSGAAAAGQRELDRVPGQPGSGSQSRRYSTTLPA